jgi:hypothetical protein
MLRRLLLLAVVCGLWGCGGQEAETIYMDYPVEFDGDGQVEVDPMLTAGVYLEPTFVPLEAGDPMEVINGFQGGTWIHLSVRAVGVRADGLIRASLTTQGGQELSQIRYGLKLGRTPEGTLDAYDIPLPMRYSDQELEALFGQTARLEVEFTASGETVNVDMQVVIADGRQ